MPAFADLPRLPLLAAATPLEPLPRLSAALGGPEVWIKRDDVMGLGGGGNKVRKLEFLLAEALAQGADVVLSVGALQSNHARLTAAAAAKAGLPCVLLLKDEVAGRELAYHASGNLLLDHLFGASVHRVARDADLMAALEAEAARLRQLGHRPYVIPVGGSNGLGSLGYAVCGQEIAGAGLTFDALVHGTGSGGTQAGLLLGLAQAGMSLPVIGISVSKPAERQKALVSGLIAESRRLCPDLPEVSDSAILVDDRHYLPGYGLPNDGLREAMLLAARTEGLLLDPVYSGKAMAGLIAGIREGSLPAGARVLFLHTGGTPGLYAYRDWLMDL